MKRGNTILESWSTKEKLCLSSAVLRGGDQNWMSVSRVLRVFGEQDRPSEWYSQKQCALQYESLLNNVGTSKWKKRSEKGVEMVDTPSESIVRKLLQERIDELNKLLEEDRKEYMKIKNDIDEIESGVADDRLDEFEREIEEEKERETVRGSILRHHEERSKQESGRLTPHVSTDNPNDQQHESKVPTSPLLTSLLQSPSSFRGTASMHSLLSPPPPLVKVNDSPTLSRLLESPAKRLEPTALFPTVKKEPVDEESSQVMQPEEIVEESETVIEETTEVVEEVRTPESILEEIKNEILDVNEETTNRLEETEVDIPEEVPAMQEIEVEVCAEDITKETPPLAAKLDSEEQDGEKEEPEHSSLNNLQDSDTMEEQQSITELDSQMVNMIVAGTGVISVSHDTSSEHLEEVVSSDIQQKDDSKVTEKLQENVKSHDVLEIDEDVNMEGTVLEVGGEMVNLGGAVVVEEEVDTTVHEVELLVSELNTTPESGKCLEEEEDSTQDGDMKEMVETPETEPHEESQEEDEVPTPKTSSNEENERDDKDEEEKSEKGNASLQVHPRNIETKPESPSTYEEDSESSVKKPTKRRLISGSGCSDSKPSSPACQLEDSKDNRAWKKSIMLVFNRLATHKYASIFLRPITNEQAPAYDTVIHRPVDLSTVKKRIESGDLRTTVEFQRDLLLMFQNAIMYNNCRTHVYEMASIMQHECLQHIELMVDAMGEGVLWRKDHVNVDKLHTRGRGEAPKRKRGAVEEGKGATTPKRRKETSM